MKHSHLWLDIVFALFIVCMFGVIIATVVNHEQVDRFLTDTFALVRYLWSK